MVTRTRSVHYLIVQQQQQKRMIRYGLNISFLYCSKIAYLLCRGLHLKIVCANIAWTRNRISLHFKQKNRVRKSRDTVPLTSFACNKQPSIIIKTVSEQQYCTWKISFFY